MLKKTLAVLGLTFTLALANVAFAEHSPDDKYEAMCQSTGVFTDAKLPMSNIDKNGEARIVQLFGHCGEQPNVLIIDYATRLKGFAPRYRHEIQIWNSPEKNSSYWKQVYRRFYEVDKQANILATCKDEVSKENFINVQMPDIMHLTVERFCSAKIGSPIFPDARGNLVCETGFSEPNLLEQGYMDYLKDTAK